MAMGALPQETIVVLNPVHGWAERVTGGTGRPTHVQFFVTEQQARVWQATINAVVAWFAARNQEGAGADAD